MIVGLDIGGTKSAASVLRPGGKVEEVCRVETAGPDETLDRLCRAVEALGPARPEAVGISAGTLGAAEGLITGAPNLPGWDKFPVVSLIASRWGCEAHLLNDAKACALAEWHWGAGRGARHMAFLTAGTGMGAGLILDGRLYLGAGNAGEVGHIRLAPDGPPGYGKRGSFEGFCSGGGIGRWAQETARWRALANPFGCARVEDITAREVIEAAGRGDAVACELLTESGRRLGAALAILIDLLNLEVIVLGNGYARAQRWLEPTMRAELARETLPGSLALCRIVPAELGEEIGNYAAIAASLYPRGRLAGAE